MNNSFKLWRLRRERKKSGKAYSKYIDQATGYEDRQFRISEAIDCREQIRDKILHLRSLELVDQAEDLGIPVPTLQDMESWEYGRSPGTVRLTTKAQIQLRDTIRKERRDKLSIAAFMLKEIVTPIIGVLGAIMGVLSLIHAFRSH